MNSKNIMNTFSAKARFELAADLMIPDRVPTAYIFHGASRTVLMKTGLTWKDIFYSSNDAVRQLLTAHRIWGHDNVCSVLSPICGIDDLGVKVCVPIMNEPFVEYKLPILKVDDDLDRLKIPDPVHKGTMVKTVETARLLRARLGSEMPIIGGFGGISTWAFFLRRADNFIKDFLKNNNFQRAYMNYITDVAIDFCIAQIRAGCDWIVSAEDAFAVDLFGPEQSWICNGIYAKRLAKAIHEEGARYILHCCGNCEQALSQMADTGADIISVDKLKLSYAKKKLSSRVALMGNIKSTILLNKNPNDVERDCMRALKEAKENGGYFLCCGYVYPMETPERNIKALIDSVTKFGKY